MQGTPDSLIVLDGVECEHDPGFIFYSTYLGFYVENPISIEYVLFKIFHGTFRVPLADMF